MTKIRSKDSSMIDDRRRTKPTKLRRRILYYCLGSSEELDSFVEELAAKPKKG